MFNINPRGSGASRHATHRCHRLPRPGVLSPASGQHARPKQPDDTPSPGRVNNLKVLSDKIDDVTTVENILRSFVRPGMSDEERSKAIWTAVVKYRHQTIPPNEFLAADSEAHDPVKIFNVYGYCMCCCCSAVIEALNRADGREARGRILNNHSVPEVRYGDGWHMFDTSLITYFPRPGDGTIASVDEIAAAITDWYSAHPGYRKDGPKLLELMRSDGWMGWKSQGPALLAGCPFYDKGYLPARTHGWDATMVEYDRKSEVYEYGYQVGHRALFSLRSGESFVREAGNRGLHVNMKTMPAWPMLKAKAPERDLVYLDQFFPGYRGGVVANGIHRYAPNLAAGDLAAGAEVYDNLAAGDAAPALRVKEAGRPGIAVIPMVSPYVDLGGRVRLKTVRRTEADRVSLALSTDNGRRFQTLWTAPVGVHEATIDLGEAILRRYAYWLKLEIDSATPAPTGPASTRWRSRTTSSTHPGRSPGSAGDGTRSTSPPMAIPHSPPGRSPAGSRPTPPSPRTRRPAPWVSRSTTSTSATAPAGGKTASGR